MAENLKALHSLSAMTHRRFSRLQIPISLDLFLSLWLLVSPSTPSLCSSTLFLETLQCLLGPSRLLVRITGVCFNLVSVSCTHAVLPGSFLL